MIPSGLRISVGHARDHAAHARQLFLLLQLEDEPLLLVQLPVGQPLGPAQHGQDQEEEDQGGDQGKGDDQPFEVQRGQVVGGDVLLELQDAHDRVGLHVG